MLHEHTVLTTDHLARLGFTSLRTAQQRLQLLHRLGVLDRFQPYRPSGSAPLHHLLGPVGARILAAEEGLDTAALGYRRQRILAVAHRLSLGHDIGVATSIIDLATHPDLRLTRWWSAARCARLYGHHTRPDAYLTLTTHPPTGSPPGMPRGWVGWWEMFYEYDTGTENLTTLAAKLAGYHRLAAATGIRTPVGFWITRPRREPHARQALAGAHHALPHPQLLTVLTGTPQPDLHTPRPRHAPRAARGRPDRSRSRVAAPAPPSPPPGGGRWTLTELAAVTATADSRGRAPLPEPEPGGEAVGARHGRPRRAARPRPLPATRAAQRPPGHSTRAPGRPHTGSSPATARHQCSGPRGPTRGGNPVRHHACPTMNGAGPRPRPFSPCRSSWSWSSFSSPRLQCPG